MLFIICIVCLTNASTSEWMIWLKLFTVLAEVDLSTRFKEAAMNYCANAVHVLYGGVICRSLSQEYHRDILSRCTELGYVKTTLLILTITVVP